MPPSRYASLKAASERYREFTGHLPDSVNEVKMPTIHTAFCIGTCDGVLYTTVRDGKTEKYIHKFKRNSRPALCVSHDGKHLLLVGGAYTFTDRGIVDKQ